MRIRYCIEDGGLLMSGISAKKVLLVTVMILSLAGMVMGSAFFPTNVAWSKDEEVGSNQVQGKVTYQGPKRNHRGQERSDGEDLYLLRGMEYYLHSPVPRYRGNDQSNLHQ
jgi:hypothetical protein